jgi:cell division protein FtsW
MSDAALTDDGLLGTDAGPAGPPPAATAEPSWPLSVKLTVVVAALTCIGLVMVASAAGSSDVAAATAKRLILTTLAVGAFVVGANVPYSWWRRHNLAWLALAVVGLLAVLIPHVGAQINGARRWINPGLPVGLQPSEFAKLALCIWVAAYCERNATRMRSAVHGFLIPLGVVGVVCLLILAEPDFGTAALTGAVGLAVLLVFGTRMLYVGLAGMACLPALQKLIIGVPYRLQRVLAFIHPWRDPQGTGYQLIQSKIAIGSGGALGRGLGAGVQKAGFLPGADNDFIFSVIGEELGLLGALAIIILFVALVWMALKVVTRARDAFGFGLALGLSWLLGMQAAAHMAVVTGSIPTKGLSLPFISAGGSSLLASMFAAGVLVNIARAEESPGRVRQVPWEQDVPAYERAARWIALNLGLAGIALAGSLFRRKGSRK